ncbi:hypothetical protein N204_01890 [Helicobacter pylori UM085]|nr:hypothetical protein N204_01890 [Helicobacter pylori UM085]
MTIGNYLILDNFLQTLKIQKSPMKKFHFRHQKIIHHYIKYMDILKEK